MNFWVRDAKGHVLMYRDANILFVPKSQQRRFRLACIVGDDHKTFPDLGLSPANIPTLPPRFRGCAVKRVLVTNLHDEPYFWVFYEM